jgi:hypothetical protein
MIMILPCHTMLYEYLYFWSMLIFYSIPSHIMHWPLGCDLLQPGPELACG